MFKCAYWNFLIHTLIHTQLRSQVISGGFVTMMSVLHTQAVIRQDCLIYLFSDTDVKISWLIEIINCVCLFVQRKEEYNSTADRPSLKKKQKANSR